MTHTLKFERIEDMTVASQRTRKPFPIKKLTGVAHASQFFEIPDTENVRTAMPKKTVVHDAIYDTIMNRPQQFLELNAGMTFVAKAVRLDKESKTAIFTDINLINGSQTRAMLKKGFDENNSDILANVSFIVTEDEDYIQDISIALNFQNKVKDISILGAQGVFDDLNTIFLGKYGRGVRKSETDESAIVYDTHRVIQIAMVMMSPDLASRHIPAARAQNIFDHPSQLYSSKARCMKYYESFYYAAYPKEGTGKNSDIEFFAFFNQFAATMWMVYESLTSYRYSGRKRHSIFDGVRLHQDKVFANPKTGAPLREEIMTGYSIPVLYSMRGFISAGKNKKTGEWKVVIDTESFNNPKTARGREKARYYINTFREIADENLNNTDQIAKSPDIIYERLLRIANELLLAERSDEALADDDEAVA